MYRTLLALLACQLGLTGCAFRAGVNDSRKALDRGSPDEALRILGELETERAGRGAGVLARFDFVRGAALYEIGRQEEARSALHAARAEDLRSRALASADRVRLAKLLDELELGRRPDADVADAKPPDAAKDKTDKADKTDKPDKSDKADKTDKPDKADAGSKDGKDGKDDKGKPAKVALPVAIACSGAVNTPAAIYGGYMTALNSKDAKCVLEHTTKAFAEKYGEMLEFAINMVASAEGKVLDEKIDGSAATLKVHEKIVISVEGTESTSERDKTLKLIVEDGTWKLETLDEAAESDADDDDWDDSGDDDYPDDDPGDGDEGERTHAAPAPARHAAPVPSR